jgi:phosphoglycolate phosphatase-like HAD superfamily hydrolase
VATLILFDIDGTLVHSGGAGKIGFNLTLEGLTGIRAGFDAVDCAGKTDVQIIREACAALGVDMDGQLVKKFLAAYPVHLKRAMVRSQGHVKPGVRELLERLQSEEDIFLGLLTGNVETGARLKLEAFDLYSFFPFGAFGNDKEDRNLLLPVAVRRLFEFAGVEVDYSDCIVIGDTPRDVRCASIYGASAIAVATGPYPIAVLEANGADLVLPDLSETERVLEWIRNHGRARDRKSAPAGRTR